MLFGVGGGEVDYDLGGLDEQTVSPTATGCSWDHTIAHTFPDQRGWQHGGDV